MKVLIGIYPGNHSPDKIDKNELEHYDYCFNFWQNAIFNIIDLSLTDGVCILNKGYYSNYICCYICCKTFTYKKIIA